MSDKKRENITLPIDGMSCAKCSAKVANALKESGGVISCTVDHVTKKAEIELNPRETGWEILVDIIEGLGYTVPKEAHSETAQKTAVDPVCGMTVNTASAKGRTSAN